MELLIPVVLSVLGVLLAIYKNYLRSSDYDVVPEGPEDHRPVEHIKSILFLEIPIELITLVFFVITGLLYTLFLITGAAVAAIDLAVIQLSGVMIFLLLFKWVMALGVTKRLDWRVLLFIILTTGIMVSLLNIRPEAVSADLLSEAFPYNVTVHLLGLVLGLGGAIILDLMIFHFLEKFSITKREAVIMHLISQMIILGLALLIVSGIALMYADLQSYIENTRFLMKMTAVGFLLINGVVLNLYVAPKMELISLRKKELEKNQTLVTVAFIVGAISAVSWFSVFFLAMLDILETFSYVTLLLVYAGLLLSAIAGGLFTKSKYRKRAAEEPAALQDPRIRH